MLDWLCGAQIITKLDIPKAYHLIRIKEGNKYITVFRSWCGQFEYQLMTFGLTNAPARFQAYIDDCSWPFIDDLAVCDLDNLLIYLTNMDEHETQVRNVFELLQEIGLYTKPAMCHFGVTQVSLVSFIISLDWIGIESDCISTIQDRPTPESVRDMQVLLGFTNFYQRFIRKYAKVTTLISDLLKKAETSRTPKHLKLYGTWDTELAIQKLKRAFTKAQILNHFHLAKPSILQTDASGFTITGILNKYDGFEILELLDVQC
jgi:hypothetical protein